MRPVLNGPDGNDASIFSSRKQCLGFNMAEITGLLSTRSGKKVNVYLDGTFAFAVNTEVSIVQGIHIGDILSEDQIRTLKQEDIFHNCIDAALRFLQYRPRSKLEIRRRLRSRGYSGAVTDRAMAYLVQKGYIDDTAFTRFWIENRVAFSPRSGRMIKHELLQKGVDSETIENIVDGIDDYGNAYRAGLKKSRALITSDY